ncbi:MAG: hypothetical protein R6V05_01905 [Candidatus Brocadiia bacterium]
MPPQGGMMGGMARGDIAAWDGSLFVLRGAELVKLDADLNEVASVEIAAPGRGGGMRSGGQGRGMMGMRRGAMMGGMARVAADSRYVYLLAGPSITVYNHDLDEVRSGQLAAPPREEGAQEEAEEEHEEEAEHPGAAEHPSGGRGRGRMER